MARLSVRGDWRPSGDLTVGVALQEPVGLEHEDAGAAVIGVLVDGEQRIDSAGLDVQQVAGLHVGGDLRRAGEAEVGRQRLAEAGDVDVLLVAVIPPGHLLTDPAGDGQRNLAIALADSRRLEFSNTLLEVGAAVAAEVRSGRAGRGACEQAGRHQGA